MKQYFLMMWAAFALAGCAGETNTATRLQEEFLQWKFGLFLHFNIATFNNPEWANGYDRPVAGAVGQALAGNWPVARNPAVQTLTTITAIGPRKSVAKG